MTSVTVQLVVYNTPLPALSRSLESFSAAALHLQEAAGATLGVSIGDCSPVRLIGDDILEDWRHHLSGLVAVDYTFFDDNLGHGGGQNRLASGASSDYLVFSNPDVVVMRETIERMLRILAHDPSVGIVDAKQIPFEHPKEYDPVSGATSWCSGAFSMVRRDQFSRLGGFDHDTFYMHGDDVDLSWRLRLSGLTAVHQPAAVVFHDKRFDERGEIEPSSMERYHSAQAALMLAHKYSRPDIVERLLAYMDSPAASDLHRKAAATYRSRLQGGTAPAPIDPDGTVAEFVDGHYGRHRW